MSHWYDNLNKDERKLIWGAAIFIGLTLVFSFGRWLWSAPATPVGAGSSGAVGRGNAPAATREAPKRVVRAEGGDAGAQGTGGGSTLALDPDAAPPLPDEKLDAFFVVMDQGDFEDMALEGAKLFPKGAVIPDAEKWFAAFRQPSANSLSSVATYMLYFDRDDRESRRIMLTVDLTNGEVQDFLVDVFRMLPTVDPALAEEEEAPSPAPEEAPPAP